MTRCLLFAGVLLLAPAARGLDVTPALAPQGALRFELGVPPGRDYLVTLDLAGTKVACPQPLSLFAACLIQPVPAGPVGYAVSSGGKVLKTGTLTVPARPLTVRVTPWEGSKPRWALLGLEIAAVAGVVVGGGYALVLQSENATVPTWATATALTSLGIGLVAIILDATLKNSYPLVEALPF